MNDQQAVNRLKRRDLRGLEALVRRYQAEAVRTAYAIVRDATLAEDVAQTAFARLVERIGTFEEGRPFVPWFMRIVARDAVAAARRESRSVSLDASDGSSPDWLERLEARADIPLDALEQAETAAELWSLLDTLPPEQRAVVVLHYYADLKHVEIASRLDLPAATIRWRLHAALKQLRRLIGAAGSLWSPTDHQPTIKG